MSSLLEEWCKLVNASDDLGVDELRVLTAVATRLAMGQKQYGKLDIARDKRDFVKEASEEALDGCVYLACELLRKPK